jgi:putative ABC transport system substrate-binding protein
MLRGRSADYDIGDRAPARTYPRPAVRDLVWGKQEDDRMRRREFITLLGGAAIAPGTERVALIGNPEVIFTKSFMRSLEAVAPSFGVKPVAAEVRGVADIERAVDAFAREPRGGLLMVPEFTASMHRELIFRLAARYRLPAVYPFRFFVVDGGLASYGPDQVDQYRRAAGYADRILRGAKPSDLPVQAPTKFDLVINLKTAKALGLDMPPTLIARADEVIE